MKQTKTINIPMPKQNTHQIVVDQEFDPTILAGYVFRKMGKQLVVYSHNGVRVANTCGSINVALGKPINAKRKHKCVPDDYTSSAWKDTTNEVEYPQKLKGNVEINILPTKNNPLITIVKNIFKGILR